MDRLTDGGTVVAMGKRMWDEIYADPEEIVLLGRFTAEGGGVYSRVQVTPTLRPDLYFPVGRAVAVNADDDLLLVFVESDLFQPGDPILQGRRVPSAMPPPEDLFQINDLPVTPSSTDLVAAAACSDPSSPFVVAWSDTCGIPQEYCIYLRWFRSFPHVLDDDLESGDTSRWCSAAQ